MAACLICLGAEPPDSADGHYHTACLRDLFGTDTLPRIKLDLAHFPALIAPEIGKMSISGMQRKALVRLSSDKARLVVATKTSRYILKPQIERYVRVPENEHLSMRIAQIAGVRVPRFGLVHLTDGTLAYIIERYDRIFEKPPRKLNQLDFCQLSGRPASERGGSTAEECAALVARFTSSPAAELHRLFRHLVVAYWIGNGDMHLKNLSLLAKEDGTYGLAPAYDLVCTWIYGDKTLTLSVGGGGKDIRRQDWIAFASKHARLPTLEAEAILDEIVGRADEALGLIERSPLPESLRKTHARMLNKRTRGLE
jgi:serine/threonine-protein kinase HipA